MCARPELLTLERAREWPGDGIKMQIPLQGPGRGPRTCISHKSPREAEAAGLGSTLGEQSGKQQQALQAQENMALVEGLSTAGFDGLGGILAESSTPSPERSD